MAQLCYSSIDYYNDYVTLSRHNQWWTIAGPDGLTAVWQRTPAFRGLSLRRWTILEISDVSTAHTAFILKDQVLRKVENHPSNEEASIGI